MLQQHTLLAIKSVLFKMYKVSYYFSGTRLSFKWFDTLSEAMDFCRTIKTEDVIEIKLYKDV